MLKLCMASVHNSVSLPLEPVLGEPSLQDIYFPSLQVSGPVSEQVRLGWVQLGLHRITLSGIIMSASECLNV